MVPTVVFLKRKPDCTAPLVKGLGGPHSPSGEKFTILSLAHKVLSDHLQLLSSCCSPAHDSPTNPKSSSLPPLALCKCHSPCEECQCFLVHTANSLVRRGAGSGSPTAPTTILLQRLRHRFEKHPVPGLSPRSLGAEAMPSSCHSQRHTEGPDT